MDNFDNKHSKQGGNPTKKKNSKHDLTLQESELKYRRLFESALDGILILNAETGEITDVNPYLIDLLGYSREEFLGKKLWEIGPLINIAASKNAFLDLQINLSVKYDDLPLETKAGKHINVEFVSNVYDEGEKKVIQCNIRNITNRKTAENKFHFFSTHDSLTKIYNRSFFEEELNRLERSRQFPISIIMLDVDGLKIINDNYGHAMGDEILFRLANILVKSFRSEDIVARIGGDEFVILLPLSDDFAVQKGLARIEHNLDLSNKKNPNFPINISVGSATCLTPCPLSIVLKDADDRMYAQKRAKRMQL